MSSTRTTPQIRVEAAPADLKLYGNNEWGGMAQGTGGSTAMANSWDELRRAGAEARARLVAAAAQAWRVKPDEITVENGVARHASGRSAPFGQLAERARGITLASPPQPKDPSRWRYIGKEFAKVDTREKIDGSAVYTLDVKLPDMLTCVVAHPPRFGGQGEVLRCGRGHEGARRRRGRRRPAGRRRAGPQLLAGARKAATH